MCSLSGSLLVVDETASTQGRWFALLIPSTGGRVAQIHSGGVRLEQPLFQEIQRKHNLLAGHTCWIG